MKNGRTEEMSADSSLSNQFEGNRFNHFMKHQHPKTASAIRYPTHVITDLGPMAIPRPSRLGVERRRRWFVDVLKGGGDMRGSLGWVPMA